MNNIIDSLRESGLTGNEAKVYLELIKKGELPANQIAKNISMDRTLTYTILNNLIDKGMISYVIKENKKYFISSDPENLLNNIKKQEIIAMNTISELKKIQKIIPEQEEITIYEGKKGLRTLLNEMSKSKNIYSFGATGKAYDTLYESPHILKDMIKKNIKSKIIFAKEYNKHQLIQNKNIESRYLEIKSEATTTILDDKVTIHIIREKPLILIIKNKKIVESYKEHFNILWLNAKEIKIRK